MPTPIEQLLSRTVYATDGTTTVWDFSFADGYLDTTHVKAYTTDSLGSRVDLVLTAPMLIGPYQLQITPALASGLELTIYRDTPKDAPLVNFTDESGFSEIALDTNARQAVMIAAEAIDTVNATDINAAIDAAETAGLAAVASAADAAQAAIDAAAGAASALAASNSETAAAGYAASINPALLVAKTGLAAELSVVNQAAVAKTAPVDADSLSYFDSAASWVIKKLTWANIKATLKTYFDTLYAGKGANADITSLSAVTSINGGQLAGLRNKIINGGGWVDQRNGGSSVSINGTANTFGPDRWAGYGQAADGVFALTGSRGTYPVSGSGPLSSILCQTTTADAAIGATQTYGLRYAIEGQDTAPWRIGTAQAAVVTLSFMAYSTLPGTHTVALGNSAGNRSYIATYTISTASTWEKKTITIPLDTSGTWATDSGVGMKLFWNIGTGTTYQAPSANTWVAGAYYSVAGAQNVIGTLNALLAITEVQLELGSVATTFEQRPYGMELALCQRYYEVGDWVVVATVLNIAQAFGFKVPKRATPTIVLIPSVGSGATAAADTGRMYQATNHSTYSTCGWTASAEL